MVTDQPYGYRHGETRVLGLDASMTATGYAVLCGDRLLAAGTIRTTAAQPEPRRLWAIFSEVAALIREFGISHAAIEQFTAFYRSSKPRGETSCSALSVSGQPAGPRRSEHDRERVDPKSMYLMKAAQSATQLAALAAGCVTFLYPVAQWKGGVRVSKDAARDRARLLYGVTTRNHNITDAIMLAHHHIHHGRLHPDRGVVLDPAERSQGLEPLLTGILTEQP